MGTSGSGNIVHIDNLYVKTYAVKEDEVLKLGEISVLPTGTDELIAFGITNDTVLDITALTPHQNGEDADNRLLTDSILRKDQIEVITLGSDWSGPMEANITPGASVGIKKVNDNPEGYRFIATNAITEVVGVYKHKEFSTVAKVSLLNDNGIISTGRRV